MKEGRLILHDRRLEGTVKLSDWPKLYIVDGNTHLKQAIDYIAHRAKMKGGVGRLDILCHGLSSSVSGDGSTAFSAAQEGYGLFLCMENLTLSTVSFTEKWKGLFDRITLYACGPANTTSVNENTKADGRRFCGELAVWTGAEVIAGDHTQRYSREASKLFLIFNEGIDFGKWEGTVYRFDPETGQGTPYKP